jgi:hypothetical protein
MADSPAGRRRDSKPDPFASAATKRYAHTLRRDVFDADDSALPVLSSDPREDSHDDIMTIAMPAIEYPAAVLKRDRELAIPIVEGAPGAAATPDSHRLTRPALLSPSGEPMPPPASAARESTPPRAHPRTEPRESTPPRAHPHTEPRESTPPRARSRGPEGLPRLLDPAGSLPVPASSPSAPPPSAAASARPAASAMSRHPAAPRRALTLGLLPVALFVVLAALALWFLHSI